MSRYIVNARSGVWMRREPRIATETALRLMTYREIMDAFLITTQEHGGIRWGQFQRISIDLQPDPVWVAIDYLTEGRASTLEDILPRYIRQVYWRNRNIWAHDETIFKYILGLKLLAVYRWGGGSAKEGGHFNTPEHWRIGLVDRWVMSNLIHTVGIDIFKRFDWQSRQDDESEQFIVRMLNRPHYHSDNQQHHFILSYALSNEYDVAVDTFRDAYRI